MKVDRTHVSPRALEAHDEVLREQILGVRWRDKHICEWRSRIADVLGAGKLLEELNNCAVDGRALSLLLLRRRSGRVNGCQVRFVVEHHCWHLTKAACHLP